MGPRPQPRPPTGRSPPPPSPPQPRKFGRAIRPPQAQNPNPIPSNTRPVLSSTVPGRGQQLRKGRPSPSPPRDSSEPAITTTEAAIVSRSQFRRLRQSPNNQPPQPLTQNTSAIGVARVIKRPRPAPTPIPAPVPTSLPTLQPAVAAQSKVQVPHPPMEPAVTSLERSKVTESPSDLTDQLDRASVEEGEVPAVADVEVTEFERVIADWEQMMAKSTTWIREALGSIVSDLNKLVAAESGGDDRGRTKFGGAD